jgi:hypothetical protein
MRKRRQIRSWATVIVTCIMLLEDNVARAGGLPLELAKLLPAGYDILALASGKLTGGSRDDYMVAISRHGDRGADSSSGPASARPLLLFRASGKRCFALVGRNDEVILRRDEGGQCDPFDGENGLVMKGHYVTVQNEAACGDHWSDYITFRFDPVLDALVFDSEIVHRWKMNDSDDPDAEAIVPDGPTSIDRADPHKPILFSVWRPSQ